MILNFEDIPYHTNLAKTHVYIKPHPFLQSSIAHYTYMYDDVMESVTSTLTLVPDVAGCIVLQDKGERLDCIFWGGTTTSVQVQTDTQGLRFRFFIEFLPCGAFSFLHHNQSIYQNEKILLDTIQASLQMALQEAYEHCSNMKDFIACLDAIFLRYLQLDSTCVQSIQTQLHQGHSIPEIVDGIGYSRRHIQRLFQERSGCSMKQFQRIERMNRSIKYMQVENQTIAQIAQRCNYYDEAHFIHDFKAVMNVSPKEYKQQMNLFYNEAYKY